MWKEKIEVSVTSYQENRICENVEISQDGKYWTIHNLDAEPIKLPMDDQVLGQIMDVCLAIIDHEDNPLN